MELSINKINKTTLIIYKNNKKKINLLEITFRSLFKI